MFQKLKEKITNIKNKMIVGVASLPAVVAGTSMTTYASGTGTTETQALTDGISGFMTIVTTMLNTIITSPLLMVAFSASFAFLAVRLVKRLKKG